MTNCYPKLVSELHACIPQKRKEKQHSKEVSSLLSTYRSIF